MLIGTMTVYGVTIEPEIIWGLLCLSLFLAVLLLWMFISSHRKPVKSGNEYLIGETGTIKDWSDTSGHIHVLGETWRAESPSPLVLKKGDKARVTAIYRLTATIEPVKE